MKIAIFLQTLWLVMVFSLSTTIIADASSHREAPLIADDPMADNTDVYAFRDPNNSEMINIIANFVPFAAPEGGPNYHPFGFDVQYSIHIDNDITTTGDDIIYNYRVAATVDEFDTFFAIRNGNESLNYFYILERSLDGGNTFQFVGDGEIPPFNVGSRSIESSFGLNTTYEELISDALKTHPTGEKVYMGPADDPFFADLGGIFDLGDAPRQTGMSMDGLACFNVNSIAMQIPISNLQKDGKLGSEANSILDPEFVIGVWASTSRKQIRTLTSTSGIFDDGPFVQVSRLGMPLTNEVVIPVAEKDKWNMRSPYSSNSDFDGFFNNPELALYMDDSQFGSIVPAFTPLRIQRSSLGAFDFGNNQDGLFPLKGSTEVAGTALDDALFGNLLLPGPASPRSVDLNPLFHTGIPNIAPYQLATGKNGNPFNLGKPYVHNFLPNGGDMLRLNMAVPATPRDDPKFSSLGLIQAAVLGLTDPLYNQNSNLEFIPNMDGFPNGRRLEDDVVRIELQAVSGVLLAAIGLGYDDYTSGNPNVVTNNFLDVLDYSTGISGNDVSFRDTFPYLAAPFSGSGMCSGKLVTSVEEIPHNVLGISPPSLIISAYPNPVEDVSSIRIHTRNNGRVSINLYDVTGRLISTIFNEELTAGDHEFQWQPTQLAAGIYVAEAYSNTSGRGNSIRIVKGK